MEIFRCIFALILVLCVSVPQAHSSYPDGKSRKTTTEISDSTVVAVSSGVTVTVGDIRKRLGKSSAFHMLGASSINQFVESIVENEVREGLVLIALREEGFDKELAQEAQVIRNRYHAIRFREKVLEKRLAPTDREMRERTPRKWVRVKFQELTLPTRKEAEEARKEIVATPQRFLDWIRKKSVGPKAAEDGFTGYIEPLPFNFFLTPEQNEHLFSLKEGEFSRIIESGLGFTIYRAVDIKKLTRRDIEGKKRKIKAKLLDEKMDLYLRSLKDTEKPFSLFEEDEAKAYRMVLDFLKTGHGSSADVVRAGNVRLSFLTCTKLEKLWTWPQKDLQDPVAYFTRLREMCKTLIVPEALLAAASGREAFQLPDTDRAAMKAKVESWLKERFYEERIAPGTAVSDDEVGKYFDANRRSFRKPKKVDYRLIRSKDVEKLASVYRKMQEKKSFDAGFAWANRQGINTVRKDSFVDGIAMDDIRQSFVRRVISGMKEGQYTNVFKFEDAYYILFLPRVLEWEEPTPHQFEEEIRARLKSEKEEKALERFYLGHFPGMNIEKNPEAIQFLAVEAERFMREKALKTPKGGGGHQKHEGRGTHW